MASRLMTGSANGSTKVEPILGSDSIKENQRNYEELRSVRKQYGADSEEYKTAAASVNVQEPANVQQPAPTTSTIGGYYEVVNRERLSNDVTNVGVAAALIGGFALNFLDNKRGTIVYLMACVAVHACTCAALMSALIYRVVNKLQEEDVHKWVKRHRYFLLLPIAKFCMGALSYLGIVILNSWNDLAATPWAQIMAFAIGVGGFANVAITIIILYRDTPAKPADCY